MPSEEITRYLEGVIGAVGANSYEHHMLWREYAEEAERFAREDMLRRYPWKTTGFGYGATVGYISKNKNRPVCISLLTATVGGHKLLFYYPISRYVDHDMISDWLEKNLPGTARREDGRINHTDAMNFCNIFPREVRQDQAA